MKTIISLLLIFSFSIANENKKKYTKAEEEAMIKEFLQYQKDIDNAKAKTLKMKKETESIKKVGKKLDEILGTLKKDKK